MSSGTVDCDGFMLEWIREGAGVPMLVIGSTRFYRRYYPRAMRDHFDMVFFDSRQWVPTPDGFDISTLTRDMFSDDSERTRVATGLERPIVVGHSQHGYLALAYARRYPDRVRGVVVIGSGVPTDDDHVTDFFERDASPERRAADARIRATRRVPAVVETSADFIDAYDAQVARVWFEPEIERKYLWDGVEVNVPIITGAMWTDAAFGGLRLEPSDTPTFLALGRYDYGAPYYEWDPHKALFSKLTYRLYERSAHHPPFEQPQEFTADIVEWARTLA